jgi:hypothetical protein
MIPNKRVIHLQTPEGEFWVNKIPDNIKKKYPEVGLALIELRDIFGKVRIKRFVQK